MTDRSVGPRCGNNPNARRTPGDQKVIDAFQAQLALRQAAKLYIESAVWEDGDPLMEVIAATIWEHCARDDEEMPQLVCDDPRTIAAFAAAVARAHAARVAPATDQAGPSRRAGLRDEIVNALGQIKTVPPVAHRREQADHVLAVLYREWPWLRAEAEETATDQAEALASCPGYETSPNLCRCPCYGCKHHCSAHDPEDVRDAEGATDQAAPDLTAEEARDLADELGTELYRAQDALAFVEECCVIADREGRQPTTADVREWLKGARCGRQLAADARDHAALRDRIAEAVRDAACNGDCGKTEEECAKERIQPVVWHHGRLAAVEGTPEQFAAAVLAVLPATVDRAAVLEQYANEAHPPEHTWKIESPRRDQWASWGVTYDDRDWAQERYESAMEHASARPFRLVRATTTYTVEAEYTPTAEAQDAPRREPHPTEADVRHAQAVLARFRGQTAEQPAATQQQPKEEA